MGQESQQPVTGWCLCVERGCDGGGGREGEGGGEGTAGCWSGPGLEWQGGLTQNAPGKPATSLLGVPAERRGKGM
jgi:hypothetical protein